MDVNCITNIVMAVAAVISLAVSVFIYCRTVSREQKLDTMREFYKIREKYPDMSGADENALKQYLRDMEFFCTGINTGLYDINIVNKMSGSRLLKQYHDYMKDFMEGRLELSDGSRPAGEYKKVMEALETLRRK